MLGGVRLSLPVFVRSPIFAVPTRQRLVDCLIPPLDKVRLFRFGSLSERDFTVLRFRVFGFDKIMGKISVILL